MASHAHSHDFSFSNPDAKLLAGVGAGAALALVAAVGRKLIVQAPTALSGEWDTALKNEHKMTLLVFDKLAKTKDKQHAKRSMLLMHLKHALTKHALEEENTVYPAMRDVGLLAEADGLHSEHGYVKQYLYDLENLTGDNRAFQAKLAYFRRDIEKHMREEEDKLFPRLRSSLSAEANRTLTGKMNKEGLKIA